MPLNMKALRFTSRTGEHQVDVCPSEAGVVLSMGPISIWLDHQAAEEICGLLAAALESNQIEDILGLRRRN